MPTSTRYISDMVSMFFVKLYEVSSAEDSDPPT